MSSVRELVYAALTGDSALNALGIDEDSCWAAGSFDGPQPTPFMVVRWNATNRGIGPVNSAPVTLLVHDTPGSYDAIRAILRRSREVMLALAASGTAANWIAAVEWQGDSGDFSDEAYRTITASGDFNVVANTL